MDKLIVASIATGGVPTSNGRTYSTETLQKAVDTWNGIKSPKFGVIGNDTSDITRGINLDRVALSVLNVKMDENDVIATMRVLDTPKGKILQDLLRGDVGVRYVTAGMGQIDENRNVTDFSLSHVIVTVPNVDIEI